MRTQGEHDAKVRFWLSPSSAEKTDSQINELENDLIIVAQGQMKIKKAFLYDDRFVYFQ